MSGPVHVRLEIRAEDGVFGGRAISDSESREFHGWIGLIGAIEALCPATAKTIKEADEAAR